MKWSKSNWFVYGKLLIAFVYKLHNKLRTTMLQLSHVDMYQLDQ